MSAYLVVQIDVTDQTRWLDYRAAVGPCIETFGGRPIVRGATIEVLEGGHDGRRLVMFEFPSIEAIRTFWNSPEYAAVKTLRDGAAHLDAWAVPGV